MKDCSVVWFWIRKTSNVFFKFSQRNGIKCIKTVTEFQQRDQERPDVTDTEIREQYLSTPKQRMNCLCVHAWCKLTKLIFHACVSVASEFNSLEWEADKR